MAQCPPPYASAQNIVFFVMQCQYGCLCSYCIVFAANMLYILYNFCNFLKRGKFFFKSMDSVDFALYTICLTCAKFSYCSGAGMLKNFQHASYL